MAEHEYWLTKLENKIFWLYLNRPERKNAFDLAVADELYQILEEEVEKDLENIRVLICTTSLDDFFTVGLDINWILTLDDEEAREMTRRLQVVFKKLEEIPIPVIAAIKGLNLTAGFELMLCADIIIAADNARFGQVETKYGLTPAAGATQRLIRLVGPLKAREIIYTARTLDAQEALQIGLINEVVSLADFDDKVKELAQMIVNNSSKAIAFCKSLIQKGIYENEKAFQAEGDAFYDLFSSGEPKEKFKAFLERKK